MGRPIKKNKMGETVEPWDTLNYGIIKVTAHISKDGVLVENQNTTWIIKQVGSTLFRIHLVDSSEEISELKAVPPASLSNISNQFCVRVILEDSTVAYVSKFYNNIVHYVTTGGNTGSIKYSLSSESDDEEARPGFGSVDTYGN